MKYITTIGVDLIGETPEAVLNARYKLEKALLGVSMELAKFKSKVILATDLNDTIREDEQGG